MVIGFPHSVASPIVSSIELTHVWISVASCRTYTSCVKSPFGVTLMTNSDKINRKKKRELQVSFQKDVVDVIVIGSVIVQNVQFKFWFKLVMRLYQCCRASITTIECFHTQKQTTKTQKHPCNNCIETKKDIKRRWKKDTKHVWLSFFITSD